MDPPAYASAEPARPAAPHRSIHDLRSQILANGSILKPRSNRERASDDHLELVVAKLPAGAASMPGSSFGMSAKHALADINSSAAASSSSATGQHYAVLVHRSYEKTYMKIVVKGQPKDTVEEALEWLLERTEMEIHNMVARYGRQSEEADCCLM